MEQLGDDQLEQAEFKQASQRIFALSAVSIFTALVAFIILGVSSTARHECSSGVGINPFTWAHVLAWSDVASLCICGSFLSALKNHPERLRDIRRWFLVYCTASMLVRITFAIITGLVMWTGFFSGGPAFVCPGAIYGMLGYEFFMCLWFVVWRCCELSQAWIATHPDQATLERRQQLLRMNFNATLGVSEFPVVPTGQPYYESEPVAPEPEPAPQQQLVSAYQRLEDVSP